MYEISEERCRELKKVGAWAKGVMENPESGEAERMTAAVLGIAVAFEVFPIILEGVMDEQHDHEKATESSPGSQKEEG